MALACYVLVVMVDVYLVANPAKRQGEGGSGDSNASLGQTVLNSPVLADEDVDAKEADDIQEAAAMEVMAPDTLPAPPPHMMKAPWNLETPGNTPASGYRPQSRKISEQRRTPRKRSSTSKSSLDLLPKETKGEVVRGREGSPYAKL